MEVAVKNLDGKLKIITDVPLSSSNKQTLEDALNFNRYSDKLAEIIMNSEPRFAVGIFGGWGTGKTSLMKMIKAKLEEKYKDDTLVVWFEAWRYDREKYLALIPFLRQLSIRLENESRINGKSTRKWNIIKKGVERTLTSFADSVNLTVGYNPYASVQLNVSNFKKSLKSDGSIMMDGESIQFHEHPTDHLACAINKLRKEAGNDRIRIVVFIDDLDRCTPDKALEILESTTESILPMYI